MARLVRIRVRVSRRRHRAPHASSAHTGAGCTTHGCRLHHLRLQARLGSSRRPRLLRCQTRPYANAQYLVAAHPHGILNYGWWDRIARTRSLSLSLSLSLNPKPTPHP